MTQRAVVNEKHPQQERTQRFPLPTLTSFVILQLARGVV